MDRSEILQQVNGIFTDIIDEEKIKLSSETIANDIEGWDSLTHIQLVVAIEKHFKIRFNSKEIQGWKNIGELMDSISSKIS